VAFLEGPCRAIPYREPPSPAFLLAEFFFSRPFLSRFLLLKLRFTHLAQFFFTVRFVAEFLLVCFFISVSF